MKKFFILVMTAAYFLSGFVLIGNEKIRRIKSQDDSTTVYVIPNSSVYHIRECPLISKKTPYAMSLGLAKSKGFKARENCFYEDIEVQSPTLEQTHTSSLQKESGQASAADPKKMVSGGFRESKWGAKQEEVKKAEKAEFFNKTKTNSGLDAAVYKGTASGMNCYIGYYFAENVLVEGRYIFYAEHSNKSLFIDDFDKVKNFLIEKYGKPDIDNIDWKNNLYKDDPAEWGLAISMGHLVYFASWELSDALIRLLLSGDNYDITFALDYLSSSAAHEELRNKAEEKAKKGI